MGFPNGSTGGFGANGTNGKDGKIILTEASDDEFWRPTKKQRGAKHNEICVAPARGEESAIKPVAFVQRVLKTNDGELPMHNALLASEDHDTGATIGGARIFVAKGAAAFVVAHGDKFALLALHEAGVGDIAVSVDGQEIYVKTGEQVVIGDSNSSSNMNLLPMLAVRSVVEHSTQNGVHVLTSEYSIPSAYANLPALKQLAYSPDSSIRRLQAKVEKSAAAMQVLTMRKGPFRVMKK
jgi:hypothetical protein